MAGSIHDVWPVVHAEREKLIGFLDGLDDEQWEGGGEAYVDGLDLRSVTGRRSPDRQ